MKISLQGLNFENGDLGYASTEALTQGQDAYIASFAAYHPVGIEEPTSLAGQNWLTVVPLSVNGQWQVRLPHPGEWTLQAYDASGRSVGKWKASDQTCMIDLGDEASGLYLLRASTSVGEVLSAKVVRP